MAGDWIKIRVLLGKDPKVMSMADFLAYDREFMDWLTDPVRRKCEESAYEHVMPPVIAAQIVAGLVAVWGIVNERGKREGDDLILDHATLRRLDDVAGMPAFGDAMASVGWAIEEERSGRSRVRFPSFLLHNVPVEERQRQKNRERQSRFRAKGGGDPEKWTAIRVRVLERDNYTCAYCGQAAKTVDHVVPDSRGGQTEPSNLVACCGRCNFKKNNRTLDEAGMSFRAGFSNVTLQKTLHNVTPSSLISSVTHPKEEEEKTKEGDGGLGEGVRAPPDGFAEFWAIYPRHERELEARRVWGSLFVDAELHLTILAAVRAQTKSAGWRDGFVPHAAKWLSERRWQDELFRPAGQSSNGNYESPEERQKRIAREMMEARKKAEEERRSAVKVSLRR